MVRPPGFEPGFLPYGCRPEAVRPVLAGLRRANARVPVLNQTRLRPHGPTEAHLIAKALLFHLRDRGLDASTVALPRAYLLIESFRSPQLQEAVGASRLIFGE